MEEDRDGVLDDTEDETPCGLTSHTENATDDEGGGKQRETEASDAVKSSRSAGVIILVKTPGYLAGDDDQDSSQYEAKTKPEQEGMIRHHDC